MFGAAVSGAFGGGATGSNQFDMAGWKAQGGDFTGWIFIKISSNQSDLRSEDIYQQSNANAQTGRVSQSYATGAAPNIPMSDSYNAAASAPVFPPAAQDQAAAVFGSNAERQGSTSGFKQEIKERIMTDLNSL